MVYRMTVYRMMMMMIVIVMMMVMPVSRFR